MLISGLLAMIRGFMREILSIAAWIIAAIAALAFYSKLTPIVHSYVSLGETAVGRSPSLSGGVSVPYFGPI